MRRSAQNIFTHCPLCGCTQFVPSSPKSLQCASCGFEYFTNPAASVAAFIRNEEGELLLCVRAKEPMKGKLDLPGGFADADESAEQALVRELREELNAEITSPHYLFSIPNVYNYSGMDIPTLDLFFECQLITTNLHSADDVASYHFYSIKDIDTTQIGLDSIRQAVQRYINENK